jgi:hypothetical protein
LCSRQFVSSAWPNIADSGDAIDGLSLQECICIGNCLQDAGTCKGTIGKIQLGGQQMTSQTADGILILGAAAVHGLEDLSGCKDVANREVAQGLRQVLDRPRSVRAATATIFAGYSFAIWAGIWTLGVGVRQVVLPIARSECANTRCGRRGVGRCG